MAKAQNVLICPLNWGLGHATRCVPIINRYITEGNQVILAADSSAYAFLQNEFPNIKIIRFKGYNMNYWSGRLLPLGIMFQIPLFLFSILKEHQMVRKIINHYHIDVVISDNRYGVWDRKIRSVLITHQLFIELPSKIKWFSKPLHSLTHKLTNRFDEVWIPDYENIMQSLSGNLSHGKQKKANWQYIGPLSRFAKMEIPKNITISVPDVLIILSGPGKQKQRLANQLIKLYKNKPIEVFILGAMPEKNEKHKDGNINIINHLSTNEMAFLIKQSPIIIARGGYTTIMDLIALNRSAYLIPTPGQWEQKYLAENAVLKKKFMFIREEKIGTLLLNLEPILSNIGSQL